MSLLEAMTEGHAHVVEVQGELGRVRDALDRTDHVLTVVDHTLTQAERAIEESRRLFPFVVGAVAVVVAGGVAFAIWRSRRAPAVTPAPAVVPVSVSVTEEGN